MEFGRVWYSIRSEPSPHLVWFKTESEAVLDQDMEGWDEPCLGSVETFVGSNIWQEAYGEKVDTAPGAV